MRELCHPDERGRIFGRIPDCAPRGAERVAMDLDSLTELIRVKIALAPLWADNGHVNSGACESQGLLPDAPICRHRQVLNDEQGSQTGGRRGGGYTSARSVSVRLQPRQVPSRHPSLAEDVGRGEVRWVTCVLCARIESAA